MSNWNYISITLNTCFKDHFIMNCFSEDCSWLMFRMYPISFTSRRYTATRKNYCTRTQQLKFLPQIRPNLSNISHGVNLVGRGIKRMITIILCLVKSISTFKKMKIKKVSQSCFLRVNLSCMIVSMTRNIEISRAFDRIF